jgi:hypothetical protein
VAEPVQSRVLQRAASVVGGYGELRQRLEASADDMASWIRARPRASRVVIALQQDAGRDDCPCLADWTSVASSQGRGQQQMDQQEFSEKLDQIEEQAQLTLAEFPKTLTKERQRMIIALVRYIRSEAERGVSFTAPHGEAEATARLRRV